MNILHLSETGLSGSPYRISALLDKYSSHTSRHIQWQKKILWREYDTDLIGSELAVDDLQYWIEWADVIHLHNQSRLQSIFRHVEFPRHKPMVLQLHSQPERIQRIAEEVAYIPIATVAQYHPRCYPDCRFIVPNCVDIYDPRYLPIERVDKERPVVSYAPSNANGRGWDDKSYGKVAPVLKRLHLARKIQYQLIFNKPHHECLQLKKYADIGIDEISTGSYHLSSLEYLSMGVATIGYIDEQTTAVLRDVMGCVDLPWVQTQALGSDLEQLLASKSYKEIGRRSRQWMETYWHPDRLCGHYIRMYEAL